MSLKEKMRGRVAAIANALETVISAMVLVAIVIAAVRTLWEVAGLATAPDVSATFTVVLGHALNLVIGVEFIKMLAKHTPGSAIEVLLFAIARQMVVEHTSAVENLLTILTIGLLFAIRKYLFVPTFSSGCADDKVGTPPAARP